jgi:hypothetical protein
VAKQALVMIQRFSQPKVAQTAVLLLLAAWASSKTCAATELPLSFSRDGRLLAAVRPFDQGRVGLALYDLSSDIPPRVLATANSISCVRFSPDGLQLCLSARGVANAAQAPRETQHRREDLHIVELDGSNPLRITYQGASSPVYSSDGNSIAYVGASGAISTIDVTGQKWRSLARKPPARVITRWIEDNRSFETTACVDGYLARYAFTPPSKHLVRVSPRHAGGRNAICPVISPNGKQLAYATWSPSEEGRPRNLKVLLQEKDVPRTLVECEAAEPVGFTPGLAWSQAGNALAFSCSRVWVIDVAHGSHQTLPEPKLPLASEIAGTESSPTTQPSSIATDQEH